MAAGIHNVCYWRSLCRVSDVDVVCNDGNNGVHLWKLTAIHRPNAADPYRSVKAPFLPTIYTVSEKNAPPPPKQNAVTCTIYNNPMTLSTALSNTHLGTVCKMSMNCVVIFFIF